MRDIVVMRDDPQRQREAVERVRRDFDAVLVHGDPALIPFEASFPAAPRNRRPADLYRLCRAARGSMPSGGAGSGDEVVVSAGGGAAGYALLRAALAARRGGCLAGLPWLLLAGSNLPDAEFAALRRDAPAGVAVERFAADFAALLRGCRVSVSQAGYNTVLDILAARARAVLVPFAAERETEQLLRAERLAALGRGRAGARERAVAGSPGGGDRAGRFARSGAGRDRCRRRGALGADHRRDDRQLGVAAEAFCGGNRARV